jgi:hypothetical protein
MGIRTMVQIKEPQPQYFLVTSVVKDEVKAIPLQAWTGPEGSKRLRVPDFKTFAAHEGSKVVSPTHRPYLPPRKYSWYWFLLEAEPTPGPIENRTRDLPVCIAVPQPNSPPRVPNIWCRTTKVMVGKIVTEYKFSTLHISAYLPEKRPVPYKFTFLIPHFLNFLFLSFIYSFPFFGSFFNLSSFCPCSV